MWARTIHCRPKSIVLQSLDGKWRELERVSYDMLITHFLHGPSHRSLYLTEHVNFNVTQLNKMFSELVHAKYSPNSWLLKLTSFPSHLPLQNSSFEQRMSTWNIKGKQALDARYTHTVQQFPLICTMSHYAEWEDTLIIWWKFLVPSFNLTPPCKLELSTRVCKFWEIGV